jgi:penicillin-binding protein A
MAYTIVQEAVMLRQLKVRRHVASVLCLFTVGALVATRALHDRRAEAAPPALIASAAAHFEPRMENAQHRWDWSHVRKDGGGYVDVRSDGSRAELTIDPALQARVDKLLRAHPTPYAAAVVLSVEDGRVLALAGRSSREPDKSVADLTMKPWAPAASIFKLVTATALVERGVSPDTRVCYHDGVHSVEESNLRGNARLDRTCNSFAFALAKSQNAIIARLAHDHLDAHALERAARALGFGASLPFALPMEPSSAKVPDGGLPFARTAAGFWNTTLSPLHAAWISGAIARAGEPVRPVLVTDIVEDGKVRWSAPTGLAQKRVMKVETAHALTAMMETTVSDGTSYRAFHDAKGRAFLPGVAVAGKTGTLTDGEKQRYYTWFAGFAPSKPIVFPAEAIKDGREPAQPRKVAFGVLVVNDPKWTIKANVLAREVLRAYFAEQKIPGVTAPQTNRQSPSLRDVGPTTGAVGVSPIPQSPRDRDEPAGESTTPATKHRLQRGS